MKILKPNEYVNIQKFKICLLLCSLTLLLSNCKKENIQLNQNQPKVVDLSKVYKLPSTPSEISLVNNLAKVTDVFKELYKDNSNLRLVNAAIYSKLYKDESILLKDLIFPQESRLVQNKKFNTLTQKWNTSLNSFSKNFWEIVKKNNDKNFELFLNNLSTIRTALLTTGSNDNNESQQVTIYFPYSEVFVLPNDGYVEPLTSIVTATADADEGFGYLPYFDNFGNFQYYIQVLVNDDYAAANPTHIIGVNGIEGETTLFEAPPMPSTSTGMSRVYIGEVICKNQYDKLISFTGLAVSLFAFALIIFYGYIKLFGNPDYWKFEVKGWVSIIILISFFSGLILLSLGIIAEYIFRIYEEVKNRPGYIIKKKENKNDSNS